MRLLMLENVECLGQDEHTEVAGVNALVQEHVIVFAPFVWI
jgi:hypothetical protein